MVKPRAKDCQIVGMMHLFGDFWTWLIIREAFYGSTRFGDFQRNTGVAKNLLSERLSQLVEAGVLEKRDVGVQGTRFAYRLTEKGEALFPVLVAMFQWSSEHLYGEGRAPVAMLDRTTGAPIARVETRSEDGRALSHRDIDIRPGPGASSATLRRLGAGGDAET